MARALQHLTPRYAFHRLRLMAYERLNPSAPWLTPRATAFIDDWLRPTDVALEWGSGRSTVWLGRRVRHLVSIEHEPAWYERVQKTLRREGIDNVDAHVAPVADRNASSADHRYVQLAAEVPCEPLDLVLVDGVLRDHCTAVALERLRSGGLLVIDNVQSYLPHQSQCPGARQPQDGPRNPKWEEIFEEIRRWRSVWTTNGVWDTALFFKPEGPRPETT